MHEGRHLHPSYCCFFPGHKFIAASGDVSKPAYVAFQEYAYYFQDAEKEGFFVLVSREGVLSSSSDAPMTSFILSAMPLVKSRFSNVLFEVLSSSSSDKIWSTLSAISFTISVLASSIERVLAIFSAPGSFFFCLFFLTYFFRIPFSQK